jgi:5-methylthioadenosine/S-adenosylhomocysteine deaminase
VSDALYRATAEFAIAEALPVATHVAESEMESALVVQGSGPFAEGLRRRGIDVKPRGRSPIAMLDEAGVLRSKPLLIHCVRADADDVQLIARTDSSVAHCPASNAKFGHGVAPLVEMLDAGVRVGLGSDSMASNNRMDMLDEARLALLVQRARLQSWETPSADDVLELATIGGARSLGLDSRVGTLEPGKQADLAAFALGAAHPTYDPASAAIFAITGARATFVAVAGRPLVRNGALCQPNKDLTKRTETSGSALSAWLAADREVSIH